MAIYGQFDCAFPRDPRMVAVDARVDDADARPRSVARAVRPADVDRVRPRRLERDPASRDVGESPRRDVGHGVRHGPRS